MEELNSFRNTNKEDVEKYIDNYLKESSGNIKTCVHLSKKLFTIIFNDVKEILKETKNTIIGFNPKE